jgi:hypothetical protein
MHPDPAKSAPSQEQLVVSAAAYSTTVAITTVSMHSSPVWQDKPDNLAVKHGGDCREQKEYI